MRRSGALLFLLVPLSNAGAASAQPAVTPDFRRDMLLVGPNPVIAAADGAWSRRDEGRVGARARPTRISEAISRYEEAAEVAGDVESRWKLARALFFKAKYTGVDRSAQLALFDRARRVGEEAVANLRRRATSSRGLASDPHAAPTYFWAAVGWGEWALLAGRGAAARTGAARKVRDYSTMVISLDPTFDGGGGYRILGRLHHRAPRVPLVTGWVSRREALRNLRLAVRTAPRNFVNRHFLAEALADGGAAERAEAIRIEKSLIADAPSPGHLVEDVAIQEEARRNLAAWGTRRPRVSSRPAPTEAPREAAGFDGRSRDRARKG
jgi:tetratricopeptide (TPR) repeat protein